MDILESKKNALIMLKKAKIIVVVGCSRTEGKPSHDVPKYLQQNGYRIIPVNPNADNILNEHSYGSIDDVTIKVDLVLVFRPAAEALGIIEHAYEKGIRMAWLQEGIFSESAEKFAIEHNMLFVMNKCMMKEHYRINLTN